MRIIDWSSDVCSSDLFAAGDLPGELEPVVKPVVDPVGGKFGRQEQVERARILAETAELDRPDPLTVELVPQILAQALTYVRPIGSKIHRFEIGRAHV